MILLAADHCLALPAGRRVEQVITHTHILPFVAFPPVPFLMSVVLSSHSASNQGRPKPKIAFASNCIQCHGRFDSALTDIWALNMNRDFSSVEIPVDSCFTGTCFCLCACASME
jgi:hypothetical protein